MNLVFHQFQKDLWQHRVWIGLWLVLAAWLGFVQSEYYLDWNMDENSTVQFVVELDWMPLVFFFVAGMLIQQLVHAERLTGTTAFWMTRPLSRLQLFGAKVLFVFAVILLPLIAGEVWAFQTFAISWRNTLLMIPGTVVLYSGALVVFMLLAALTASTWEFFLWGFLFFGLVVLSNWVGSEIDAWLVKLYGSPNVEGPPGPMLETSLFLLCTGGVVVGGGLLLVYQYWLKRRIAGMILAALLLVVVTLAMGFGRCDFFGVKAEKKIVEALGARPVLSPEKVDLRIDPGSAKFRKGKTYEKDKKIPLRELCMSFHAETAQTELLTIPGETRARFQLPNGTVLVSEEKHWVERTIITSDFVRNLGVLLNVPTSAIFNLQEPITNEFKGMFLNFPLEQQQRISTISGTLKGNMLFGVYELRKVFELPLQRGASWTDGTAKYRIQSVKPAKEGCEVVLMCGNAELMFDPWRSFRENPGYACTFLLLYHQQRREVYVMDRKSVFLGKEYFNAAPLNFVIGGNRSLMFNGRKDRVEENSPAITPEWLKGAVLLRVDVICQGAVTKPFVLEGIKLDAPIEESRNPHFDDD